MNRTIFALVVAITLATSSGHMAIGKEPKSTPDVKAPPGVAYKGGDGSDCKHAVIIKGAGSEAQETEAETKWLEAHYPGYTKVKQQVTGDFSVGAKGTTMGPVHDVVTITTAAGEQKTVCFGFKPEKMYFKPAASAP